MSIRTDIASLECSSILFKIERNSDAYYAFSGVSTENKNQVYRQTWIHRGCPTGDPEYGMNVFCCLRGRNSSAQERAVIVDSYVMKLKEEEKYDAIRLSVNDAYYDKQIKDREFRNSMERNQKGIRNIVTVAGAIGAAAAFSAFTAYEIFKHCTGR